MRRPELTPARGKSPHADQPDATRQRLIGGSRLSEPISVRIVGFVAWPESNGNGPLVRRPGNVKPLHDSATRDPYTAGRIVAVIAVAVRQQTSALGSR